MTEETKNQKIIGPIAESTLSVFSEISLAVGSQIGQMNFSGPASFASMNTFTSGEAIKSLGHISDERRNDLQILSREPAIARIVAEKEDGTKITYFICRAAPISISGEEAVLVSYRAPAGRLRRRPVRDRC